jgi:F0F1-type ATP synthase epsilon subunit
MKLTIHTPQYKLIHDVAWLEINTPTGNYIIQKGHAPMITPLSSKKVVTYRLKTGKQESISILHGIVKIDRESATVVMTAWEQ